MGFVNAQEMARLHPDTFEAPSALELSQIREGDNVRVCVGSERFWVLVTHIDGTTVTGTVNNDLVFTGAHGLDYGDHIAFHLHNIYAIFPVQRRGIS